MTGSHVQGQADQSLASGSRFVDDDGETNHLNAHSNSSCYRCHKCDKEFKDRRQLRIHIQRMHIGQPVNTDLTCDERSLKVNNVETHPQTHI